MGGRPIRWVKALSIVLLWGILFVSSTGSGSIRGQDETGARGEEEIAQGPTLIEVTPASAPVLSVITLRGSGFSARSAENVIEIGGLIAPSRTLTSQEIQAIIPDGLRPGPVRVRVITGGQPSNALTLSITSPPVPDVLVGVNYTLAVRPVSHLGRLLKRAQLQVRVGLGGETIFPGALTANRGSFPTPFFQGLGTPSFAVAASVPRGSLYATPLPARMGLVKDAPVPDLPSPDEPMAYLSATTNGVVALTGTSVRFFPLPSGTTPPIYTPIFVPDPAFEASSEPGTENRLLLSGVWLETSDAFVGLGAGPIAVTSLPAGAGSPLAPPIPQRNPEFSIAPDSIGSPHPFTETTLMTMERGIVKIANGLIRFIPFPADAGRPLGSPVPRSNPAFNPLFSPSEFTPGDPRPFTEQLLVSVANGLVIVEDETADFVAVPTEAGRVIAQPLSLINPRFTLFPTSASPDEVQFFLPTIVLVAEHGVAFIDDGETRFIPLPEGAGRIVSPPLVALNPDFNPFFPLSGVGSPRPFLSTLFMSTTKGLVSIREGRASFIPVPAEAGQVLSPPLFALNPAFNPTYDPANPIGSPMPFGPEVLIGTTEGVVILANGVPQFIPLPVGAGLPVNAPIPLTEFGVGMKIIVPVTNGIVQITGNEPRFIPLPRHAGEVVGAPYIEPSGRIVLAVTRGLARVTGAIVEFIPLPEGAGEVINGPVVLEDGASVILQTTRGFVRIAGTSTTFIPLPEGAGQHVVPRLVLSQAPAGNQPPVADAGPDRTVGVGMSVTFDGSASFDPDGVIVNFAWDFGDGTFASGPVVTHAYSQTGQFTVTLTVTDDEGAQSSDSARINVVDTSPPTVTLQSPVGGETISAGSRFTIRWISSDNVAVISHEIWLAPDGVHFNTPIATGLSGFAQSFDWSVPTTLASSQARIRVMARDAAGNVGQAESGPFAIRDTQPPSIVIHSPEGGEVIPAGSSFLIRWTSSDNVSVVSHDILLAVDGFNFNSTIAVGLPGSAHQFNWSVPISIASPSARIRIIARDAAGNMGRRDSGSFTIRDTMPPTVSIQSPRGGETLVPGTIFTIRWSSSDNLAVASHDLLLATDGVHFTTSIASGLPGSAQSLAWSVPTNLATDSARIRVIARDAAGNIGQSESGVFAIRDTLPPTVTVHEPFPGQTINSGSSFTIRWRSSDNVEVVSQDILLSTDGGASFSTLIASGLGGRQTSFLWSVPGHLVTNSAIIRVRAFDAAGNVGRGEGGPFTIRDAQPPSVVVIAPSGGQIVPPGTTFTIIWNSSDNVGITSQDILLSTNGGRTFSTTIVGGLSGHQQSFPWSVPRELDVRRARIRVRAFDAAGNVGIGETENFSIRDNLPPAVTVTAPGTGEVINPGTVFTIRWTSSDNVGVSSHDVQFSTNGGLTFTTLASGLSGQQHHYDWSVPIDVSTSQARIRIVARDAAGNEGRGETGNFTIRDTIAPSVTILAPTAGQVVSPGSLFTIRWRSSDNIGVVSHEIRLSTNGGRTFPIVVASSLPGSQQSFDWSVPLDLNTTRARLRVRARDAAGNEGRDTTANFTIRDQIPPSVTLIEPTGGEVLQQGTLFTIRWTSSDNIGVVSHDLLLSTNGGRSFSALVTGLGGGQHSFPWTVPIDIATTRARLRVIARDAAGNSGQATSGNFTIEDTIPPSVTVVRPSPGEIVTAGRSFLIQWTSSDNVGIVSHEIRLSTDGGRHFPTVIAANLAGSQQSFNWNVPSTLSSEQAVIRVLARDGAGNSGQGESGLFVIQPSMQPPTVRVIAPNGGEDLRAGTIFTIRWTSTDDRGIVSHDIFLSTDGGRRFDHPIRTGLPGHVQSFDWAIPDDLNTRRGRIRVVAHDTDGLTGQDDSDGNFSIRAEGEPTGGDFALVASGDVTVLEGLPDAPSIRGTIPLSGQAIELAVAPNRRFAIVLTSGSTISVISELDDGSPREVSLDVGGRPAGVAISGDGRMAVILLDSSPVSLVRITGLPHQPVVGSPFPLTRVAFGARDIALSQAGTVAITAQGIGGIAVIDGMVEGSPTVRAIVRTGPDPGGVAFASNDTAFVVNRGGDSIVAISGLAPGGRPRMTGRPITEGVGLSPRAIDISSDGSVAVVTNQGSDSVSVFQVSGTTLRFIESVNVGSQPSGLSLSRDGDSAIVANAGDRSVSILTGLRSAPRVASTLGPSNRLLTAPDGEQSVAYVP